MVASTICSSGEVYFKSRACGSIFQEKGFEHHQLRWQDNQTGLYSSVQPELEVAIHHTKFFMETNLKVTYTKLMWIVFYG